MIEAAVAPVAERLAPGAVPLWVHPEWDVRFPWLVQGTTGRGDPAEPFDLGLSGDQPVGEVLTRWRRLLRRTALRAAVHARQVHGARLHHHAQPPAPGLLLMAGVDGHFTDSPDLVLSVSVADCVPVFLLEPERRAIALLHAGWRGVAAGILEAAVAALRDRFGCAAAALWMHCGPAICEPCYPVGPEVHAAVGAPPPPGPRPLDLRAMVGRRAAALGLDPQRCTVSAHCTRCARAGADASVAPFFSHRAGDAGRQMAVLGIRGGRHEPGDAGGAA